MDRSTLTPSLIRLLESEEEIIDRRAVSTMPPSRSESVRQETGLGRAIHAAIVDMPRLPIYAGTLLKALNSPDSTSASLASILREDPFLAAQILKNVNSSFYGFSEKIVDLQHAITLLGINQVHLLVLYHGMRATLPNTRTFLNLQGRCILLSYLTSAAAELVCPDQVPLYSTQGLLNQLGKGVIYLAQSKHAEIEDAAPMLDHFKIGAMLLKHWDLPDIIHETIRLTGAARYAPISEIPEPYRRGVSINTLAHAVMALKHNDTEEMASHLDEYVEYAGFGTNPIEKVAENHIFPHMEHKKKRMPQGVRNFLEAGTRKTIGVKKTGMGSLEKRALERSISKSRDQFSKEAENSSSPRSLHSSSQSREPKETEKSHLARWVKRILG